MMHQDAGHPQWMEQRARYPHALAGLVSRMTYKDGWEFALAHRDRGESSEGLNLDIKVTAPDSYDPGSVITVPHSFPVPPAVYDERSWRWWLLRRILQVEQHEACEMLRFGGEVAFPPAHGPGNNSYLILEYGSDADRRMDSTGELSLPV
jgi:hypothetical protein